MMVQGLKVLQKTNYPWSGDVKMTVSPATPSEFVMYVRIPGWSTKNSVKVNGKDVAGAKSGEYFAIRRRWAENDTIDLSFDMTTHLLKANPAVTEDRGRVAFQRGPIVFCMEHLDQPDHGVGMNLAGYTVLPNGTTTAQFEPTLLDGVMVLTHPATISKTATDTAALLPGFDSEGAGESYHGEVDSLLCMGESGVCFDAGLDSV